MKKETVVRQNRCDKEMNLLLYGCFFLYFAMQFFIVEPGEQAVWVNRINLLLYLVFVPGFLFCLGYRFSGISRVKEEEQGKKHLTHMMVQAFVCYVILSVTYEVCVLNMPLRYSLNQIITFMEIPAVGAVFFAVAAACAVAILLYRPLQKLSGRGRKLFGMAAILLLCAFLRSEKECYSLMAALIGAADQAAVPAVPYFAYFLFGMWIEEKKPGFQWKIAAQAAAVTVLSLILYKTPLQDLCRVSISVLPIYLMYAISEGMSDLALRFYGLRFVTDTAELVFGVCAVLLTLIQRSGSMENAALNQVIAAGCMVLFVVYGVILFFWFFSKGYERWNTYFTEKVKHKTAVYFLIYTIVFAGLLLLAFSDFIKSGRTLLWRADGISQYYPKAVYFAEYIRNFFSNLLQGTPELLMYDFRLGFGSEVTYSLEPLYFLFALLGKDRAELTYTILILLRFYLAGVTFSIFCLYFKKNYITTFLASCIYVFCGFSFYGGARHAMFMIPMILFPLQILSIEEIIRGKRWYLCTIVVAISLFSNYYFLYMSTFGMGIYFLVRFFCQKERESRTFKKLIQKGLMICGTYLLGVGMSCIVLVTTFGLYVGSDRSSSTMIKTPSLFYYGKQWLLRCFLCFPTTANSPGEWLKLGFLPIAFFAVLILFLKKGRKELKLFSVIAVIMMAFPIFGYVLNGFSSVLNRWCYMAAMLAAYITADCLEDLQKLNKREKILCAAGVGLYGYLGYFGNYLKTDYVQCAFWCLLLTYAGLLLCQEKTGKIRYVGKQGILIWMTVVMIFVNAHTLYGVGNVVGEYTKSGHAKPVAENTPLRALSEIEDDSFFRAAEVEAKGETISSSMILDYNGTTTFNSTINSAVSEYLEAMGVPGFSVTHMLGVDNRAFLAAPAAVKYYASYEESKRTVPYGMEQVLEKKLGVKTAEVYENQYALPIGYTYREAVSREEVESYETQERQEVLMQRVMLENVEEQGTEEICVTGKKLPYETKAEGLYLTENALTTNQPEQNNEQKAEGQEETRTLSLTFRGEKNAETYLILKNAVLKGDGSEEKLFITLQAEDEKVRYGFRADDDRYGTQQEDYVFHLGYHENGLTGCTITFARDAELKLDALELYSQPMENLKTYTDELREDVLEQVKTEGNCVDGTISLAEDKYLVLSIPYQNGWMAYVDGKETELLRANYMYMALPLEAGEHEIHLEFAIPGVKYALLTMASSGAVFLLLLVVSAGRKYRKNRMCKKTEQE